MEYQKNREDMAATPEMRSKDFVVTSIGRSTINVIVLTH